MPGLQHPSITFVHGSVISVDCEQKVANVKLVDGGTVAEEPYDYLVAATGLRRIWPTVPQSLTRKAYLAEAGGQVDKLKAAKHGVAVVGGGMQPGIVSHSVNADVCEGAVGVEMAAELKLVRPELTVTLIHSRDMLLSSEPLPDDFKQRILEMIRHAGVEVIMGKRVDNVSAPDSGDPAKKVLRLSDGSEMCVSEAIDAVSRPTSTAAYLPREALDSEQLIPITPELNFQPAAPSAEFHFAIGDLVARPGIKRCGGALHTGAMAAHNIHQHVLYSRGHVDKPQYVQLAKYTPSIAVAVGANAISYGDEQGTKSGKEVMEHFFGDDLGLKIVWDWLQLGKEPVDCIE